MRKDKQIKTICWSGKFIRVDKSMWSIIYSLLQHGYKTMACCSGHGRYSMSIVYKEGQLFYELFSGYTIPRSRNFYRQDKKGYFYIPEIDRMKK